MSDLQNNSLNVVPKYTTDSIKKYTAFAYTLKTLGAWHPKTDIVLGSTEMLNKVNACIASLENASQSDQRDAVVTLLTKHLSHFAGGDPSDFKDEIKTLLLCKTYIKNNSIVGVIDDWEKYYTAAKNSDWAKLI
jgi:hypothetical protein